jgi:lipoyl(octanoyl) transferase
VSEPVGELLVADLGTLPYAAALELQRDVARRRISGEIDQDVLLLVEHPPVVTLGRTAKQGNLIASAELLAARGVELFEVERGGDVTFHGPGQLVGYPIIDLKRHRKDLHWYLRQVEQALIDAVAEFGLVGGRVEGYTGVWVSERGNRERPAADAQDRPGTANRKIASIGVHARDWVTWHGFALNVNTDLRYFDLIVPCGITDVTMTSVARERDAGSVEMRAVADSVARAFGRTFGLRPAHVAPAAVVAPHSRDLTSHATT